MLLLEHGIAFLAVNQLHRNALAHPFRGTPDALLQAVWRGGARQAQCKELLLVHLLIGIRCNAGDLWATSLKLIAGSPCQCCASHGFELGIDLRRAAHASGQVLGEVKDPFLFAVPAALAFGGICVVAFQRDRGVCLGVAKSHAGTIQLNHHLAHCGDIALRAELAHAHRMRGRCCQPP